MDSVSPSQTLAYVHDEDHGISVPVTSVALDPSPDGSANGPFMTYRTEGPGSDPVRGLLPFRASWIDDRGTPKSTRVGHGTWSTTVVLPFVAEQHRRNGRANAP